MQLSGTWVMDPARSESAHQAVPIGSVVWIVRQTPTEITIETRRTEAGKTEFESEVLSYKLDGSESTSRVEGKAPVTTKAHWDGRKLVTETERTVNGASVTTRNVHTLNGTGKELKVDRTLTVQHGYQFQGAKSYGTGTDIFVRSAK